VTKESAEAAKQQMEAYAKERGLFYYEHWTIPEPTQLLQHGFTEQVPNLVMGDLPGGLKDAWLAHFDYLSVDSKVLHHLFTVVLARAPASVNLAPRVLCHDRDLPDVDKANPQAGLEALELDDKRFRLESDAFLKRYSVWADHDQDPLRAWQLFDPALISWLTDEAPRDLSFELQNGALACFVPGVVSDAKALDALCLAASRILERVREIDSDGDSDPAPVDPTREQLLDRELAEHPFDEPPKSVRRAAMQFGLLGMVSGSSWPLGAEAFFRSHAAALGLERMPPSAFLASHIDTVIPGVLTQVAKGLLPGTKLDGYLLWSTENENREIGWQTVLAEIDPLDNGYAFTRLDEADAAEKDGYNLNSDGGSISIFKPSDPRGRDEKELREYLDRACPLLELAVKESKKRP
jgi:hypothetical protein